ncbi:MAG: hypothetical protein RL196_972 [Actinomycetota bacterium]|jgi:shikimate kinase
MNPPEALPTNALTSAIVLIGPMGVGKTTVGKKLAKVLRVPFIDTDSIVTSKHGDISKIFEEQGEPIFRGYEEDAVAEAISAPAVVATGGGAVLSALTRERLKDKTVVYLSSDGRHMGSRLKNGNRPLIKNGLDDWRRIYDQRRATYESVSNFEVLVSGLSLSAAVAKIRELLGV